MARSGPCKGKCKLEQTPFRKNKESMLSMSAIKVLFLGLTREYLVHADNSKKQRGNECSEMR